MRISDWSSDVCSSDLRGRQLGLEGPRGDDRASRGALRRAVDDAERDLDLWRHVDPQGGAGEGGHGRPRGRRDRKRDVLGKSVAVRVDLGGRSIITKNNDTLNNHTQRKSDKRS